MDRFLKQVYVLLTISVLLLATFSSMPIAAAQTTSAPVSPLSTDTSMALKQNALAKLNTVSCSGNDASKIDQVKQGLQTSIINDFSDAYHVNTSAAYDTDLSAVQRLQTTSIYKSSSSSGYAAVVSAVDLLIKCDRELATNKISDAFNASLYVSDQDVLSQVSMNITHAQDNLAKADQHLSNGNNIAAVQFYKNAWIDANVALAMANSKTVPTITLTSWANGAYTNQPEVNIIGVVNDVSNDSIQYVTVYVNGNIVIIPVSNGSFNGQVQITEGTNNITVIATDAMGNVGTASTRIILDTIKPSISITGVTDGQYYNSTIKPVVTLTDINLNISIVTLDGASYDGSEITNESSYVLQVSATDLAGNTADAKINFTVDKTRPSLYIRELSENPSVYSPEYFIAGVVDPDTALVINDNTIVHNGTFGYSCNVSLGANTVTVMATDLAGNVVTWSKTRLIDEDLLPDFYEFNCTHTDPMVGDSDGNGIPDDLEDPDHDCLTNGQEYWIGSDPLIQDSDDDGLPDQYEVEKTGTSPVKVSTFSINDSECDPDTDNLTNLQEYTLGTEPLKADTDGDDLKDGDEIARGTDPLLKDSDNDGMWDDAEIKLGTNPLAADSNGNGIPDNKEYYIQPSDNSTAGVNVTICAQGDISRNVSVSLEDNKSAYLRDIPGIYKTADIKTNANISWAIVKLYYDPATIGNLSDYALFQLTDDNRIELVKEQGRNETEHYLWGNVSHFSYTYAANKSGWRIQNNISNWYGAEKSSFLARPGETIKINVNVHNNGTGPADNVSVKFTIRNNMHVAMEEKETVIPFIAAGNNATASVLWTVVPGYVNDQFGWPKINVADVLVEVDQQDIVIESNESNNEATKNLLSIIDTDGDGLSDYEEVNGMRVQYPLPAATSDPTRDDTDGDGLKDGEEMGIYQFDQNNLDLFNSITAGYDFSEYPYDGYHYQYLANPSKIDSDNDGLNDSVELELGTNPFDREPIFFVELVNGYIYGNWMVDDPAHGNMGYLIGMIGSVITPGIEWAASVRDICADGYQGHWEMFIIDVIGGVVSILPMTGVVDELPEIGAKLVTFVGAHPGMLTEVVHYVLKAFGENGLALARYIIGDAITLLESKHAPDYVIKVLLNSDLPDEVIWDLAKNSDSIPVAYDNVDGLVVGLIRYNTHVDVRYINDGDAYIEKLGGKSLSKAQLGENAAKQIAQSKGYEVLGLADGFKKTSPYEEGFDVLCRNPKTKEIVIIEAKILKYDENVGTDILSTTITGKTEMTDEWIDDALVRMADPEKELITPALAKEVSDAKKANKLRKELVVVENIDKNGKTIKETLADPSLGFKDVYILKVGRVMP